jgi:hypothetical protein
MLLDIVVYKFIHDINTTLDKYRSTLGWSDPSAMWRRDTILHFIEVNGFPLVGENY